MAKEARFTRQMVFTVEPSVYEEISAIADEEGASVATVARRLLHRGLKVEGQINAMIEKGVFAE